MKKVFAIFLTTRSRQMGYLHQLVFVCLGSFFLAACSVPDYLNPVKGYEVVEDTVTGWFEDDEEIQTIEETQEEAVESEVPESLGSDQENRLYEDEVARDLAQAEPVTSIEQDLDMQDQLEPEPDAIRDPKEDFRPIEKLEAQESLEIVDAVTEKETEEQPTNLSKRSEVNRLSQLDIEAFASLYQLSGSALVGSIYYDIGSSEILRRGELIVQKTVDVYKKYRGKIHIIGYASQNPGSEKDLKSKLQNFEIASKRAEVVARRLIEMGVDLKDLIIDSKSNVRSSARRSSIFHFAKDRRVDIFLTK